MKLKRPRVVWGAILGLLVGVFGIAFGLRAAGRKQNASGDIPVATVRRGAMNLTVDATGELQASHTVMLTAPSIGGDTLQITRLVHTGEQVKKGDVVIEFDPSGQQFKLEQSRAQLEQAQQEIAKAQDDAAVLAAQDKVALLKARYDIRKAELDVQEDELVSKIQADKNQLALDQAKRAQAELEKDVQSHADSGQAGVFLAQEKYNKAKLAMDEAQENLQKMNVTAPMDGLVSIQKNMNAAGGIFFTGMTLPEYRAGDQAQPGSTIAQIMDPEEMNIVAHVSEQERSNVHVGQTVDVTLYAMPDKVFQGAVKSVGGIGGGQLIFDSNARGSFDVTIAVPNLDPRLRPGLTGKLRFDGQTQKDVLYVPKIAVFIKDGKQIVYLQSGNSYQQRPVQVVSENESSAAIAGIQEGMRVALRDPTAPVKTETAGGGAAGAAL